MDGELHELGSMETLTHPFHFTYTLEESLHTASQRGQETILSIAEAAFRTAPRYLPD